MKIKVPQSISNTDSLEDLRKFTAQTIETITTEINGRLIFGENVRGQFLSVVFPLANTQVSVEHTLGRMPTGFLQTGANAGLVVYNGATNTDLLAYFKATAAGTASVFLF